MLSVSLLIVLITDVGFVVVRAVKARYGGCGFKHNSSCIGALLRGSETREKEHCKGIVLPHSLVTGKNASVLFLTMQAEIVLSSIASRSSLEYIACGPLMRVALCSQGWLTPSQTWKTSPPRSSRAVLAGLVQP